MTYPFIQCRWCSTTSGRRIDLIVIHTAETPEGVNTAASVANYFRTTDTKASAHYCVDGGGHVVQSCREQDVAYAAPGANHNGIHVELSGRASQTVGEWGDPYSMQLLATAARLVADLCARYNLPVKYVPAAQLAAGGASARGITTHYEVTQAFRRSTHTDPGPNFPIIEFVNAVLGGTPTPPKPDPGPALPPLLLTEGAVMGLFKNDDDLAAWFVRNAFLEHLLREPESAEEAAAWVGWLREHGADAMTFGIVDSPEGQAVLAKKRAAAGL